MTTNSNGQLVLTFDANSGADTVARTLSSVAYSNSSSNPPASVQIDWTLDDGGDSVQIQGGAALQATGSTTVNIALVNDAPTVTIDPIDVEFTEQSPVGIDINIVIGDADDTHLEGATVRILTGYENGVDSLNWTPQAGIIGNFDALTGTITFSGTATVADYQTLLRTVSFVNNSNTPDTTTRTVEVIVDDGTATSTAVTRNINITSVNDVVTGQPVISGTLTEHETLTADTTGIADEDGLGSFTYQWYRDGSEIGHATGSTYVLNDLDVGANVTVTVSYTDGEGNLESSTSNATGPVVGVNDAPTFGSEPGVAIGHGSESYSQNEASVALANGSVLFTTWDLNYDPVIGKLGPDGQLDIAFGNEGYFETSPVSLIRDIKEQADGKFLVTGDIGTDIGLARYNADGTLDASFGTSGSVVLDIDGTDDAYEVAVHTDGTIVVVGATGPDSFIARFTSTGVLDNTFDGDGIATVNLGGSFERLGSVTILPLMGKFWPRVKITSFV